MSAIDILLAFLPLAVALTLTFVLRAQRCRARRARKWEMSLVRGPWASVEIIPTRESGAPLQFTADHDRTIYNPHCRICNQPCTRTHGKRSLDAHLRVGALGVVLGWCKGGRRPKRLGRQDIAP